MLTNRDPMTEGTLKVVEIFIKTKGICVTERARLAEILSQLAKNTTKKISLAQFIRAAVTTDTCQGKYFSSGEMLAKWFPNEWSQALPPGVCEKPTGVCSRPFCRCYSEAQLKTALSKFVAGDKLAKAINKYVDELDPNETENSKTNR